MLIIFSSINCFAISEDTQIILEQMNKRFEQIDKRFEQVNKRFEQVDKRFEQVDKRFEQIDKRFKQVDKRFETVFNILYILMGLVFASPFIAIYLRDKKEQDYLETKEKVKDLVTVLKELAQDDPRIKKSLSIVGLQ
jgi:tetrahydromethanopterin S-methyltransferase subunit G